MPHTYNISFCHSCGSPMCKCGSGGIPYEEQFKTLKTNVSIPIIPVIPIIPTLSNFQLEKKCTCSYVGTIKLSSSNCPIHGS
jgi:hypothetical protein